MLDNMDKVDRPLSGDDAIFSHMRPNGVRGVSEHSLKIKNKCPPLFSNLDTPFLKLDTLYKT
ncbi:hypothetical protein AN390_01299 [Pseudoalteromonas sp. P1-11]|nr:hypothetical protein AN390_01299 [Pseudoalteromonas sp. P1-11]